MSNIRYNSIIDSAISHGFKYFDTAPAYCNGLSEHRLGNYFSDIPNISDYKFSTKVGKLISPNKDLLFFKYVAIIFQISCYYLSNKLRLFVK